ncbi:EmrB/QacA family drug resistance transporter, partial [Streptomyces albiflaviniger]|nr:EmrB/QacA family drug resistance transporter [Streptomyces albiflaviniger]
MLLRIQHYGSVEPALLAERTPVPLRAITEAVRQIEARGLGRRYGLELFLTDDGRRIATRLYRAREASLAGLLGDWWSPDRPTDLTELVDELTRELCGSDAEQPREGTPRPDHRRPPPPRG